jgi:hypothetical protein
MEQTDLLRLAVDTLERIDVPYLVVGSVASIAYGESRFTHDIDIVAAFSPEHVADLLSAFPQPEFYLSDASIRDAIRNSFQFNVIHPASGNKIDFILPRDDRWAKVRMARRRPVRLLPDRDVFTAAPEDVIIGKLWYYSEGGGDRHLRDIAGILRVTGAGVDRAEVERWARELGYLEIWEAIVAKVDAPDPPPGPGVP